MRGGLADELASYCFAVATSISTASRLTTCRATSILGRRDSRPRLRATRPAADENALRGRFFDYYLSTSFRFDDMPRSIIVTRHARAAFISLFWLLARLPMSRINAIKICVGMSPRRFCDAAIHAVKQSIGHAALLAYRHENASMPGIISFAAAFGRQATMCLPCSSRAFHALTPDRKVFCRRLCMPIMPI